MDASTVGDTTITTAALTTRTQEIEILESIYESGSEIEFKPFYHKSNNFEHAEISDFATDILEAHQDSIAAFRHDMAQDGNTDLHQVEAVHSAIHVSDFIQDSSPLVIVDGNEQKARPFLRALSGLESDLPPVAHCQQAELYYPSALLTDIAANYLAHTIDSGEYESQEAAVRAVNAKQARSDAWGQSYHGIYASTTPYSSADVQNLRGDTVRERVYCWYEGAVMRGGDAQPPMTDSLTRVIAALRRDGFERVASNIEQL